MEAKINKKRVIVLFLAILVSGFLAYKNSFADDTADKIKELEDKAKAYQQIIDIKQKQEDTLDNQVSIIETEIGKLESESELKKNEIESLNKKIAELEKRIEETEISIDFQKKVLADLIQVYYENMDQEAALAFLGNKNLSSFLAKDDRLVQVGDKTNEILRNIKSLKEGLEKEKVLVEEKRKETTDLYFQLEEKTSELGDKKEQKELLIVQTQGEQAKYEKLLAKVEEQKQELLNIDEIGGGLSADKYPKPPSSAHASTNWYYSQRDSRWANQTIGNSKTLMKSYGCAVTSVAMAFTYHNDKITPGSLAKKKIYYWDLIAWPSSSFGGKVSLSGGYSHGNISWSTIDKELKNKNPVIVYIKKTKGSGGHYVVIHTKMSNGKYVVHDPYWGANLYLSTSQALVGTLSPSSGTKIDQMIIYK